MRYRLIVWDFDGTLANTMALALATYNDLAARHGFRPVDDPAAVRGMTTRAFLRQHGISLLRLPLLMREYWAVTRQHMPLVRVFDGLPEVLARLMASGVRQGVLSSNSAANIRACLSANGVEEHFDFVIGYPRLFGKGRTIRRLLKKDGIEPARFLYIGDEVRDVEAAKEAGVAVGAAGWGFHTMDQLSSAAPTYLWSAPAEVLSTLSVISPQSGSP
jgi:phosphoglycolate phosphatase